jgi:hypothetical protein
MSRTVKGFKMVGSQGLDFGREKTGSVSALPFIVWRDVSVANCK